MKVTPETADTIERARQDNALPVTGIASLDAILADAGVTEIEQTFPHRRASGPGSTTEPFADEFARTYTVRFGAAGDVQAIAAALGHDSHVEYAQPNYVYTINHAANGGLQ